jgi:hypothetical protein
VNRNFDATQEFLADAIPVAKTRDERIAAARVQVEGGQQLARHLITEAQKAVVLGRLNDALLLRGEVEQVLKMVKIKKAFLEQEEAEQIGINVAKRWPNFFERREIHQTAIALHKTDEIVLSEKANLAVQSRADQRAWKNQKVNRNIAPARQGVADLMGATKERNLVNEKSVCSRHCQKEGRDVQGRSNCPYCLGQGFNAARKLKEAGK